MRLLFNTGRAFEHFARRVVLWLHCIAFPSAHKKKKKKKKQKQEKQEKQEMLTELSLSYQVKKHQSQILKIVSRLLDAEVKWNFCSEFLMQTEEFEHMRRSRA